MITGVGLASPTAVCMAKDSSCERGELIGSMTSQSKPAALIEFATSGEAVCSTTPTVGWALSFAKKELISAEPQQRARVREAGLGTLSSRVVSRDRRDTLRPHVTSDGVCNRARGEPDGHRPADSGGRGPDYWWT